MTLIKNDETLRRFMPNVFATAKGETPLFDKLTPWLIASEQWLKEKICGEDTLAEIVALDDMNVVKMLASQIVVSDAVRCAVPSLDLVLTPNGFGIVSNTNVAPASKERVERLIASLLDMRDKAVEQLLNQLPQMQSWTASAQCRWFTATLFPNIDLVSLCGFTEHRWEKYLELRSKVLDIEDSLAEEYFSPELLVVLRDRHLQRTLTAEQAQVVTAIRNQVIGYLRNNSFVGQRLQDIVNYIRLRPTAFPEWHNSATAKLFSPPKFVNKKNSPGYFF